MGDVATRYVLDLMRAAGAVRFQAAAEAAEHYCATGRGPDLMRALNRVFATVQANAFDPQTLVFEIEDCEEYGSQLSCASQACLASLRLVAEALQLERLGDPEAAHATLERGRAWLACMATPAVVA